jgi:hypothetical protein
LVVGVLACTVFACAEVAVAIENPLSLNVFESFSLVVKAKIVFEPSKRAVGYRLSAFGK